MSNADKTDDEKKVVVIIGLSFFLPPHRELTDVELVMWKRKLSKYPLELIEKVADRLSDDCALMPSWSEFVKAIEGDPSEKSLRAWTSAFQAMRDIGTWESVRFDDPAIHHAISRMGGWTEFGTWEEKDRPFRERQFRELYNAYRSEIDEVPDYLPGAMEISNGTKLQFKLVSTRPTLALAEGSRKV